jgi:DNA-binding transcriptional LysR family regulator
LNSVLDCVYHSALQMLGAVESFRTEVNGLHRHLRGELNIGLTDNLVTLPHMRITHALAQLKDRGPDVRIQIRMIAPSQVEQGVLDGSLHVGVVPQASPLSGLEYQPLYSERSLLYCAVGHPLFYAADAQLDDARLDAQEAIAPTFRLPAEIQARYQALNCTASASDREGMAFLILTGRYIGYLPDHYATFWVQQGRLRALKAAERFYDLSLSWVTRKGRRPHLVLESFLESLYETR